MQKVTASSHTSFPIRGQEVLIPAEVSHTVINIGPGTNRWLYGYRHAV